MASQLSWEDRGVCIKYSGIVSAAEVLSRVEETQQDSRFDNLRYVISDYSDAVLDLLDDASVFYFTALHIGANRSNNNIRHIYVGQSMAVKTAINNYFTTFDFPESFKWRLFSSIKEAREWVT